MIVPQRRLHWYQIVLTYRGTALQRSQRRLAFVFATACAVTYENERLDFLRTTLTPLPFTLIGLALGIFLGFRSNTSYDRFWEGRRLWGQLVNVSRNFARQTLVFIGTGPGAATDDSVDRKRAESHRTELVHRTIAFVHALRMHLREAMDWSDLSARLPASEVEALRTKRNVPSLILQGSGERLRALHQGGLVHPLHLPVLEESLSTMVDIQGGCERIKNTPIPHSYTVLIHGIVALYCCGLPFGIVDSVHWWTPVVVLIVSYAFLGLDAVGDEIEDPFGTDDNDLPLAALSRTIEIDLRQALGETDVPPPLVPDEHDVLL